MNAKDITTPAQALAALEQARKILEAVALSPATSAAPGPGPHPVDQWTEETSGQFHDLLEAIEDLCDDLD